MNQGFSYYFCIRAPPYACDVPLWSGRKPNQSLVLHDCLQGNQKKMISPCGGGGGKAEGGESKESSFLPHTLVVSP